MELRIISCEIMERYQKKDTFLLLDLRSHSDYEKEHIPNALWVDWESLEETLPALLSSQSHQIQWIILYCDHGNTSLLMARDLARAGYRVMSLNGGFAAWKRYQKRKKP